MRKRVLQAEGVNHYLLARLQLPWWLQQSAIAIFININITVGSK